jgi:hypothetical protein
VKSRSGDELSMGVAEQERQQVHTEGNDGSTAAETESRDVLQLWSADNPKCFHGIFLITNLVSE